MKKYMMIHDENLCIGCQGCSVACRHTNDVPRGSYRLQVRVDTKGKFPNLKMDFLRHSCVMCEDSPCVGVCPTGASFKTDEGITLVDGRLCVGCKYCMIACPYDARYLNPVTKVVDKCTFCFEERVGVGMQPACVSVCPTDALVFGREDDPQIVEALARNSVEYPKAHLNTKPLLAMVKNRRGGRYE